LTLVSAGVLGLLIGSFLTVVVDRVPEERSIVRPGSACGACGTQLGVPDLVPVLSWVVLRGRCRHCGANIGLESVLLELSTCALFVAMAAKFELRWALGGFLVYGAGLLALAVIDLHTQRLPREITYTTAALGIPLLIMDSIVRDDVRRVSMLLLGAAIALAFMAAVYVASRGGMGDGDVRLAPLLGAYLGWQRLSFVPVGLFLGFLLGSVVGLGLMTTGKAGRKTALPFGPFLVAGALLTVFVGDPIADVLGW
jgi:leader peptidase (prepilin peptidase) / N-methyltransferase